jgi:hypothetical protein
VSILRWLRDEDDRLALEDELQARADRIAEYAPFGAWPLIELGEVGAWPLIELGEV